MFLLVAHFTADTIRARVVPADAQASDPVDAEPGDAIADVPAPVVMLARSPFCLALRYARSTEDGGRRVLVAEFDSAAEYRRALSPFDMRTEFVPWLSTAEVSWSGVSEVLLSAEGGRLRRHEPTVVPPDALNGQD